MALYPEVEAASYDTRTFKEQLKRVNELIAQRAEELFDLPVTSTKDAIEHALHTLPADLPQDGIGLEATTDHLLSTISPALMPGQAGPRTFGLVIGGVTPAAQLADMIVTSFDPCVQEATASVAIESLTLSYLLSLLSLPPSIFTQNIITTGATASNLLGLSLGRDYTISAVKYRQGVESWSVPEQGFGGVGVDVFIADAHASVKKAAALCGIGRANVIELGDEAKERQSMIGCFDLEALERRLRENWEEGRGSIVATSFGEVNTGAINSDTPQLRSLCDKYYAWLHIDAAFGAFATLHPDFAHYKPHLVLGDSITSDAHKWLNVPYDCGLFFSRQRQVNPSSTTTSLYELTGPGKRAAAYLTSSSSSTSGEPAHPKLEETKKLQSPLFLNIENSRRFRALPLYASLLSLGSRGYTSLIRRNISFARTVDAFLRAHPAYDVLAPPAMPVMNIVLFAPGVRAPSRFRVETPENPDPAATFVAALNRSNEIFVTPTVWRGRSAVRLAVSNWMTTEEREWAIVKRVLEKVMEE
ncbi:hypothetical protein JCM1840_005589 [Sporobolomyces johnsonii]